MTNSTNYTYKKIDSKIIELLEAGHIPWEKPFDFMKVKAMNPTSDDITVEGLKGHTYKGFNGWLLNIGIYKSPFWVGFTQVKHISEVEINEEYEKVKPGHVKKGESGFPIMYPYSKYFDETGNQITQKQARELHDDEVQKRTFFGYSTVFNVEQCANINPEKLPNVSRNPKLNFNPIDRCESVISGWDQMPKLDFAGGNAYYSSKNDEIILPKKRYFESVEAYYATLFHEMIHATGHEKRLDRGIKNPFWNVKYSFEELVAEIGSAYLCGQAGIAKNQIKNKTAYLQNWLQAFKDTKGKGVIIKAQTKAKQAVDFILGDAGSRGSTRQKGA